ncbi:ImmA/IrrE family metallo-endopeptidase [Clostridium kluyveri]|uniref:ImmA/IrrE family metallo-endopeptidase n=1 Tax=Clostridium kluyveri TaxID=1534 RepID=UPI0022471158|nr:ImmA/IrrE family metallo-endopeptidase [Clostridium kluyveri]UZQ49078.1 hypothetical protein OP486_14060 [Clostridium kluyveri]
MGYEDLLKEAENLSLVIKEKKLKLGDGLCYGNRIAISKDLETLREKNGVLAEELGHYYTSHGNILDQSNMNNRKQEKRARNWAYEKLAGIISIVNAFEKGIRSRHDLAEHLNITENFLEEAIQHYREKYGLYCEIDTYVIYFEPSFGIFKKF